MPECIVCGVNEAPEDKACVFCFFSGRYFEEVLSSEERSRLLTRIRELEQVKQAEVWHHGESMFNLTVALRDGRYIVPGLLLEAGGQRAVVPAIPPVGELWGVAVFSDPNLPPVQTSILPDEVDDDKLVSTIEQISTLEQLL